MHERRVWILVALGLVLTATIARLAINFASALPPGIDAAYYPLQTRSWLMQGRLMYDDLPLIFWINAAVAKVLIAWGWEPDAALLLASRLVDSLGPPWIAAWLMAIGYTWSDGRRSALAGCTAAALSAVLWPPAVTMLSEFQKNSLGLVWMSASIWACVAAMRHGGLLRWVMLAATLMLAVLTHIGAFAATAMIVGLALVFWTWQHWRHRTRPITHTARTLIGLVTGAVALTAVFFAFDPRRLKALLTAPMAVLGHEFTWGHRNAGPALTTMVVIVVVAVSLYRLWRDRRALAAGDAGIVIATSVTALVLVGPNDPEYVRRLALMAWVPISILLMFLMARRAVDSRPPALGRIFVGFSVLVSIGTVLNAGRITEHGVLTDEAAVELIELSDQIPEPESTLIIATHGHEWWAGYFLHTPVRVVSFGREADSARRLHRVAAESRMRYQRVLYLRQRLTKSGADDKTPSELDVSFRRRHTNRAFELYEFEK